MTMEKYTDSPKKVPYNQVWEQLKKEKEERKQKEPVFAALDEYEDDMWDYANDMWNDY